ncbi:hypothetical protein K0U83_12635 [bacterium]|nr:hypothetical protein [bacterium]
MRPERLHTMQECFFTMGTSSSLYRFAIHSEATTTYFNREGYRKPMAHHQRILRQFHRLPTDRWLTAAEACDILRGFGVKAHTRTLQHLLKSAAVKEAGVLGRNVGYTTRKQYLVKDAKAFMAYHMDR